MKFRQTRTPNPFDNPFIAALLHLVVMVILLIASYFSIMQSSFLPLGLGFVLMTVLEGIWLYFRLRK